MKKVAIVVFVLLLSIISKAEEVVIIDHNCVDVSLIPDEYLNKARKMLVNYVGESHARGVLYGFELLAAQDARYEVDVNWTGKNKTDNDKLRISRTYWDGNSWDESCGEQHFWTNTDGRDMLKNYLSYMENNESNPVSALGFGWCWDMNWHHGPGGDPDPVFGVRWAGSTEGGASGDLRWGIDYEDSLQTHNKVCLQDYFKAIDEYNTHKPNTVTFFTTGPVDKYLGESGYQRFLKNEAIRQYVKNKGGYLFDYADILSWEGDVQYNVVWNNITYQTGDPDLATGGAGYDGGHDGCHINQAACIKLAKAMWWMLAKMNGWENEGGTTGSSTNHAPGITSTAGTSATIGREYIYNIVARDVDGDAITYRLENAPAGMIITGKTIFWTPSQGTESSVDVTLVASDGKLTDTETFTIAVQAITTGLEPTESELISLYPNPTDSELSIKCNSIIYNIQIVSVTGTIVYEELVIDTKKLFDLQNLSAGIYLVKIKTSDSTITKRIIKK